MGYGQMVKQERERQGLSLARLSQLSGVSIMTIHNWERGTVPAVDKLDKVMTALGVSITIGAVPREEVAED